MSASDPTRWFGDGAKRRIWKMAGKVLTAALTAGGGALGGTLAVRGWQVVAPEPCSDLEEVAWGGWELNPARPVLLRAHGEKSLNWLETELGKLHHSGDIQLPINTPFQLVPDPPDDHGHMVHLWLCDAKESPQVCIDHESKKEQAYIVGIGTRTEHGRAIELFTHFANGNTGPREEVYLEKDRDSWCRYSSPGGMRRIQTSHALP
jgi:hypothetical protein